ncbi:Protein S100 [Scophthalmus maximus]|uniref:Protein S100 n=1 Tax=Scophthalmus maximus TaxID=52904 RepID=A0A2U9AY46_SCOMX|nr:Protein S100 [Scophthalmus maximus]
MLERTLANPAAADQLMSSLDKNNDGELHFLESWQMIGHLACKPAAKVALALPQITTRFSSLKNQSGQLALPHMHTGLLAHAL